MRVRVTHLGLDHVELADAKGNVQEDQYVCACQEPKIRAKLKLGHLR